MKIFSLLFSLLFTYNSWSAPTVYSSMPEPPPAPLQIPAQVKGSSGNKLFAGDVLTVTAELPSEIAGALPQWSETPEPGAAEKFPISREGIRILSAKVTEALLEFTVTSYEPGQIHVRDILLKKNDKVVGALSLKELSKFEIEKLPETEDIKAPLDPLGMRLPWWAILLAVICGLLVLSLIILGILKVWKLHKDAQLAKQAQLPEVAPKTPLEILEEQIKVLDASNLLESGSFKKYYFGVSEAAKKFLTKEYGFPAEDLTTRELNFALQKISRAVSTGPQWITLFEEMDPVKFAKEVPSDALARGLSARILHLARESSANEP